MENFLEKISSYNLLNNLLPGVIFNYFSKTILVINTSGNSLFENLVFWYFVGMIISRIGSLIIEPLCKKIGFVIYADYGKFKIACEKDPKIDILLEVNNMYRSFFSLFIIIIFFKIYVVIMEYVPILVMANSMFYVFLAILFGFSYRKQTHYIKSRVELNCKKESENKD